MAEQAPLNIAIIGCGAVSERFYAPALLELEGAKSVRVAALYDPTPANARALNQKFPAALIVDDLDSLWSPSALTKPAIDLAIIASPAAYHAKQSIDAMKAGIAVLCEKPMCTSSGECEAMLKTAKETGSLLAVGLARRFYPDTQFIRQLLRQEILGPLQTFHIAEGGPFSWPAKSASLFRKGTGAGGVLLDLGAHVLDLLIWWLGIPQEVSYADDAMGGIESNCRLALKFASGAHGTVRLSRDCRLANRYYFQLQNGWLAWQPLQQNTLEIGLHSTQLAINAHVCTTAYIDGIVRTNSQGTFNINDSFVAQIKNVVASIKGQEELVAPGSQAKMSIELIEDCYQNKTLLSMPWLTDVELKLASQLATV